MFLFNTAHLLSINNSYSQNADSIITILEGKWEWYWTSKGGYAGGHITPEDAGFNITIEFKSLHGDSINFYLYKDDTLVCDIITPIFPVDTIAFWGINKNVIPCLNKYLYKFTLIQEIDFLGLLVEDRDHIAFLEPDMPEGPRHYFERKISNTILQIDQGHLINIYPNPLNESTILNFSNPEGYQYKLYVLDLSGKVYRIVDNITTSEYVLEKGDLKQGFYFVELRGPIIYRGKIIVE